MEEISKMLKVAEVLRETLSWHVYESTEILASIYVVWHVNPTGA